MSRENTDETFKDLMQSYEEGEIDWEDVKVPDFDNDREDSLIDLNIDTEVDLDSSSVDERPDSTRFHELKQAVEGETDYLDESQTDSSKNNSDPFIYLDENELKCPEENNPEKDLRKQNNRDLNDKFDQNLLVDSGLSEYSVEYIIMEWLQYLVDQSTVTDAYIALNYYHDINWINQEQKEDIQKYLYGFSGRIDKNRVEDLHTCNLTNDNHRESLKYINKLKSNLNENTLMSRIYP